MISVDKAVIARYRKDGKDFEILVDCEKAMEFELTYYGVSSFLPKKLTNELNNLIGNKIQMNEVLLELTENDKELFSIKERKKLFFVLFMRFKLKRQRFFDYTHRLYLCDSSWVMI